MPDWMVTLMPEPTLTQMPDWTVIGAPLCTATLMPESLMM
jgi:hypothetical protein